MSSNGENSVARSRKKLKASMDCEEKPEADLKRRGAMEWKEGCDNGRESAPHFRCVGNRGEELVR